LGRLLNAINYFDSQSPPYEVIIVDNYSASSLSNNNEVTLFLESNKSASIIFEKKPGLTSARTAGINASKYDWIVFFDDDNEPHESYLVACSDLVKKYPQVGVWGPGKISVEFNCKPNDWLLNNKYIFQDKSEDELRYDNKPEWQECYPYGTGMVVKREIALTYVERIRERRYTLSDRNGKSLSSGGDVQLVFTTIEKGLQAGVAPTLMMNHLIDSHKANLRYMVKQQYGTASASIMSFNQVFIKSPISLSYV
jgi:glycosyltransferase involved in cell wall biosynthesis